MNTEKEYAVGHVLGLLAQEQMNQVENDSVEFEFTKEEEKVLKDYVCKKLALDKADKKRREDNSGQNASIYSMIEDRAYKAEEMLEEVLRNYDIKNMLLEIPINDSYLYFYNGKIIKE